MNNVPCILSGRANEPLAQGVSNYLDVPLVDVEVRHFADGEIFVQINENVRGKNVFVLQPTSPPVNNNLMELLLIIDTLKRASAASITAVIPYYGYARQDRKVLPRVPISAKLVADLITTAGTDRVLTIDLHVGQIQGFFNIPVDNLFAIPVIFEYLKDKNLSDIVLVSPDAGGVERARFFAKKLGAGLAIIDKRRTKANVSQVMHIIGDVAGKTAIIVDDIVDTAGTMIQSAEALRKAKATAVYACCTHAVLSHPAITRIQQSLMEELVVTDTILLSEDARQVDRITVLSVANLIGEAIKRISEGSSVSSLFV